MMKKLFCILMSFAVMALCIVPFHAEQVSTSAMAFVLYCPDNGEVLLSQNSDRALPMASTTKIMTTLLTLEKAAEDDRVIEFTDEMIAEGSSMYLKTGEKVRLSDLAVGMMMQSGNDAANAAAISISGSIESFADLMNEKARAIGMERTHFVTPSGLDDPEHYSCAYDMALLMAYALQNRAFADITAQTSMTVDFVYPEDKRVTYPNHNRLLSMYSDCIGGKTGYTGLSGRCLVTAAKRDGLTLIAVTLDDPDDWDDHMALYDYGFDNYSTVTPHSDRDYALDIVGGDRESVALYADEGSAMIVPKSDADTIRTQVFLPAFAYAPVKKGEQAGKIVYTSQGSIIKEVPLYYAQSVGLDNRKRDFITYIKDLFNWHN